MRKETLYCNW